MMTNTFKSSGTRILGLVPIAGTALLFGGRVSVAQESGIPVPTSVNAMMVALVDHAAHEIWEGGSAQTLSGRDWQKLEQHAIQLAGSGTLTSLGGTGSSDSDWVMEPGWQMWTQTMTDGAMQALAAVREQNQEALNEAGGVIVDSCEGCHRAFKPEVPTEGILHIPHYER